jgi:hypothetical protein
MDELTQCSSDPPVATELPDHWHPIPHSRRIAGCGVFQGTFTVVLHPDVIRAYPSIESTTCCQMARSGSVVSFFERLTRDGPAFATLGADVVSSISDLPWVPRGAG